jgi:epoxide hydrolase-like predicted phosphatase
MINTIISDLGGVFLNRGIWLFWDKVFLMYRIPVEKSKEAFLKNYKGYFSGKITEEVFWKGYLDELKLTEDWKKLREILLDQFCLNEGMGDLYSLLSKSGYKLILLSDQTNEWWPIINEKFGVAKYFSNVVISSEVGLSKPDPEIYKYALKLANSLPYESIFIDDLENNLIPAKELGISTILYKDTEQLKKELANNGVTF